MTAIGQETHAPEDLGKREFERAEARTAHNYHPLPVVVAHAEGAWMTDVDGRRFLDLPAGYSALTGVKRLRGRPKGARDWLVRVRRANPTLFSHWRFFNVGSRTSEAV